MEDPIDVAARALFAGMAIGQLPLVNLDYTPPPKPAPQPDPRPVAGYLPPAQAQHEYNPDPLAGWLDKGFSPLI
jgi:hypothetical protein